METHTPSGDDNEQHIEVLITKEGVFYRYCVQERNSDGGRGKSIIGEFYELEDFYSVMRTNNLTYHTNEEYLEDVQKKRDRKIILTTLSPDTHRTSEENLGLSYLTAVLRKHGYNVEIIDGWLAGRARPW